MFTLLSHTHSQLTFYLLMFLISYPKAGFHVSFLLHPSPFDCHFFIAHLMMIPTDLAYMKHFGVRLSWLWKWTLLCFKHRQSFTPERWSWLTRRFWKSSVCLSTLLIDAALQTVQDVQTSPDKDVLSATLVLDFILSSAVCPGVTLKPLTPARRENTAVLWNLMCY